MPLEHRAGLREDAVDAAGVPLGVAVVLDRQIAHQHRDPLSDRLGRRRRRGDGPAGRGEIRVVLQDRPLEPLQRGVGLQAELVVEPPPKAGVGGQRVRLPAAAVQGEHQLPAQPLAQRVLGAQRLELADDLGVGAAAEVGVDPLLERSQPELDEPGDLGPGERLEGQIGERLAAELAEGLAQRGGGRRRVAGVQELAPPGEPRLEAVEVELPRLHDQGVARRPGHERVAEAPPEPRHVGVHRRRGARRRLGAPQGVDQLVDRHRPPTLQEQARDERARLRSAERERRAVADDLERAQHPEVERHGHACSPPRWAGASAGPGTEPVPARSYHAAWNRSSEVRCDD